MQKKLSLMSRIKQYKKCYFLIAPFYIIFLIFVIAPIAVAIFLSLTDFDMLRVPNFTGLENYLTLFFEDDVFLVALTNTLVFAVITGPISYFACLFFAWMINELKPVARAIMTFIFYAPSMSGMLYVIWAYIFSGDMYGLLNSVIMSLDLVDDPVQWLTDTDTMLTCIIIVQIWMSLGTSFLAFIAGLQNVDTALYEAGAVDGIKNRTQELIYITLPSMGPQLLFSAVMQIGSAFAVSGICMTLAGFPSTDNAALTIATHAYDFGMIRFEMGYACAITVVLFGMMVLVNHFIQKVINKYAAC